MALNAGTRGDAVALSLLPEDSKAGCLRRDALPFPPTDIYSFPSLPLIPFFLPQVSTLRPRAHGNEANSAPSRILLHLGERGKSAHAHGFLPKLKRVREAVEISAHQSLHLNRDALVWQLLGKKATMISFKVYLIRQKETDFFDSFTALIRLHSN